jgi:predicted ABC-type transport system involved in lysophospholipase L1 biosynthesis ATPase subunit
MSAAAESLLQKMKQSKHGWRYNDLANLYRGFGFDSREGGNHTIFFHPVHRHLMATVARHRTLAVGYVHRAIALVEALKTLESSQEKT